VPQDRAEAVRWWKKAIEGGSAGAGFWLGIAYQNGEGVPQDYEESWRWFRRAGNLGDTSAQHHLGIAYFMGKGVPQDYTEAYFWSNIATAMGEESERNTFVGLRDQIAAKLPREDLSAAQKRCLQWLEDFEKRKAQK